VRGYRTGARRQEFFALRRPQAGLAGNQEPPAPDRSFLN
jgi:hypothetical protein